MPAECFVLTVMNKGVPHKEERNVTDSELAECSGNNILE